MKRVRQPVPVLTPPPNETTGLEFSTFRRLGSFEVGNLQHKEPSCFNGIVAIRSYVVTVNLVEEPVEVLQERLLKLWRECDNMHHYGPLQAAAAKLNYVLPTELLGVDRKKK